MPPKPSVTLLLFILVDVSNLINNIVVCVAKVSKEEVTEVTSSFRHTKITTAYRAIIDVNDQKTSRKDLLQLKI